MPRVARGPRYFPSKEGYFVNMNSQRYLLAKGPICKVCCEREAIGQRPKCRECAKVRDAADLRFAELRHLHDAESAEDNSLVFAICNRYLKWVQANRKERTYQRALFFLTRFCEKYERVKIKELKPIHLTDWLAEMKQPRTVQTDKGPRLRKWGQSSRRMAVDVVLACLSWAKGQGLITKNPLADWRKANKIGVVSRSKESLISPEDHRRMLEECEKKYRPRWYASKGGWHILFKNRPILLAKGARDDPAALAAAHVRLAELRKTDGVWDCFGVLLRLLEHTGARPGEIYNATAAHWHKDGHGGAFVYEKVDEPEDESGFTHKNARHRERVIHVADPELVEIVDFFCKKYPAGPVLRNLVGQPWTDNAVWWRMDSMKEKLGLNPAITPYSYRHTSITNMIVGGKVEWGLIAELHGTSLQMLQRHYKHLDGHRKSMAEVWAMAKGSTSAGSGEGRP